MVVLVLGVLKDEPCRLHLISNRIVLRDNESAVGLVVLDFL